MDTLISCWAPGGTNQVYPDDVGVRMDQYRFLTLQMPASISRRGQHTHDTTVTPLAHDQTAVASAPTGCGLQAHGAVAWASTAHETKMVLAIGRCAGSGKASGGTELRYRTQPELRQLWHEAGLQNVMVESLGVKVTYDAFDELWLALLGAAGPVGAHMASLDEPGREQFPARARQSRRRAFTLKARA
jgi:hypothetical protein